MSIVMFGGVFGAAVLLWILWPLIGRSGVTESQPGGRTR